MNIERLEAIRDYFLAHPNEYNQQVLWAKAKNLVGFCGVTHCICGRAILMFAPNGAEIEKEYLAPPSEGSFFERYAPFEIGGELLGLSVAQSDRLFNEIPLTLDDLQYQTEEAARTEYEYTNLDDRWPFIYAKAYVEADSPEARAQVLAARINHFIATDGEE